MGDGQWMNDGCIMNGLWVDDGWMIDDRSMDERMVLVYDDEEIVNR